MIPGSKTMADKELKKGILEAVSNQIRDNNPPCTKKTYERLLKQGYSASETQEMIAAALIQEMFYVMTNKEVFNETRYAASLAKLPDDPLDD